MNTPEELINKMQSIKYGWIEKDGTKHDAKIKRADFEKDWYLQNPKDLDKTKIGVCFDQVEYERLFFEEKEIPYKTILIFYNTGIKTHMHTFLVYKSKKKYCWIENTYEHYIGINEYDSMKELIKDLKNDFLYQNRLLVIGENVKYYMYDKPNYGINCEEFVTHCLNGKLLNNDFSNIDI